MPYQPPEKKPTKPADIVNMAYPLAVIVSLCVTPPLHTGIGTGGYILAPLSFLVLVMAQSVYPEVALYIPVWLIVVIWQRITADRGAHSEYRGKPWLTSLICRRESRARQLESLLLLGAGIALQQYSSPLGDLILVAGIATAIVFAVEAEWVRTQIRRMRNAQAEMEFQARLQKGDSDW